MALLEPVFVSRFRDRILNVHPSLLPAFPGVRAIEQALEYGVHVYGVTVHLVDEGMDTGPILLQRAVEMREITDPSELHARLQAGRARAAAAGGAADGARRRAPRPAQPEAAADGRVTARRAERATRRAGGSVEITRKSGYPVSGSSLSLR